MLDKIATAYQRNDEAPNIELAEELCESEDRAAIAELVSGLKHKDKRVANDCIKVLYEIGERKPYLISEYYMSFVALLSSRNNRLVWGGMVALSHIVELEGLNIYQHIGTILVAIENGSVITTDNGISVVAKLCNVNRECELQLFPRLIEHLQTCRPKEVAQHAERISICVNAGNINRFLEVLNERKAYLSEAQMKRINKLEKDLQKKAQKK